MLCHTLISRLWLRSIFPLLWQEVVRQLNEYQAHSHIHSHTHSHSQRLTHTHSHSLADHGNALMSDYLVIYVCSSPAITMDSHTHTHIHSLTHSLTHLHAHSLIATIITHTHTHTAIQANDNAREETAASRNCSQRSGVQ